MSANQESAKAFLARKPPKLDAAADAVLLPNGEITRVWEGIPPELIDAVKAYLFEFTDVANDGTPSKFVDSLKAQGNFKCAGILRNARISSGRDPNNENQYYLKQTLRSGYARAADYGEAVIAGATYAKTNASTAGVTNGTTQDPMLAYVLRFPNIAPNAMETFRATLMADGTVAAPTVQNQIGVPITLPGTWNTVKSEDKQEDDGSHSLYLTIAQSIYVIVGYTNKGTARESEDYHIFNVPLDIAQQIVTDFGALGDGTRRSASISYRDSDKMCDVILRYKLAPAIGITGLRVETTCRFYRNADYFFSVADPIAFDIPTTVTTPGQTYEKRVTDNGDGTYDVVIITTVRLNQTLSYISEIDAAKTTTTDLDLGRTTAPAALVQTTGTIKRRHITVLEDCAYDVKDDSTVPNNQASTNYEDDAYFSREVAKQTESPVPISGSASVGTVRRIINNVTEAGNFATSDDVQAQKDVPVAQEFKTIDADGTRYTLIKHGQAAADSLPSTYSAGDPISEVLNKLTDHQRYNIESQLRTPGAAFVSDWFAYDDIDGTSYYRVFVNVTEATLAAGGVGSPQYGMTADTRNSLQPRRNAWGLYDGVATREAQSAGVIAGVQTFEREYDTVRYQFAVVGGLRKYRRLEIHVGIKQTTSEMAAAAFLGAHENGKIVAISGGRVFRATYCDINPDTIGAGTWIADE